MVNLYFGAIACTTIHTKHRKITYVPSSDRKWLIFTFFIPRPVVSEWFFFQILRLRIRTTRYYCAGILPKSVENFFYNSVPFNVHVNQIGNDISGPVASAFRNVNRPKIRQKMRSIIAGFERRAYKRHLNNRRVHPLRHHNNDPFKISIVRRMTRIFFFAESIYIFFFFPSTKAVKHIRPNMTRTTLDRLSILFGFLVHLSSRSLPEDDFPI